MIHYAFFETALGQVLLTASEDALIGCYFVGQKHEPFVAGHWQLKPERTIFKTVEIQFLDYLASRRRTFDIPTAFSAGTPFQRAVWQALLDVPFGTTISYQQLAERIGNPTGVRAVAQAVGRNPLSVIVPCHRIIGKDGTLTGYAGGIERKRRLLEIENRN
jgi:methylated-DNA-[protein]-cysteine S-methyltransferase